MKKEEVKSEGTTVATPELRASFIESLSAGNAEPLAASRCDKIAGSVNNYLDKKCSVKKNHMKHCDDKEGSGCSCGGGSDTVSAGLVDLFVLIDASGSMGGSAKAVSDAATEAIKEASTKCDTDLRVTYLGVDGTWPATVFNKSHRTYLTALTTATLSTDNPTGGYDSEEGANAIEDLSKYADWRKGACRAIFYISDEELDGSAPIGDAANEAAAVSAAVTAANANSVTVFAHHLTYQNRGASVIANYNDLCNLTGGKAFFSAAATKAEYITLLSEIICSACGDKCKEVSFPDIHPCVSISWGDSDCDCIETDDVEILCITVCNCYSNVSFSSFKIGAVYVTDAEGKAVPVLPDGTPSVQIIPLGPISFGDVPPCVDGEPGCVSRELALWTRGAKGGAYKVRVTGICYDIAYHYDFEECFALDLCQD